MSWINLAEAKNYGAHKNYLTPEIWQETRTFKGDIFWHFDFSTE